MTTIVFSPTPGLGDLIVRFDALRILAQQGDPIHAFFALPASYAPLVERLMPLDNVSWHFGADSYRKLGYRGLGAQIEDARGAARLRALGADRLIILTDDNSTVGAIRMGVLARLATTGRAARWAIRPRGISMPFTRNLTIPFSQKRTRYETFIRAILREEGVDAGSLPPKSYRSGDVRSRRRIIIAPGSKRPNRRWPYYAQLVDHLAARFPDSALHIVGSADERDLLVEIAGGQASVDAGADFTTLIDLLSSSSLVVCNDAGLMHLAVELEIPTVAICRRDMFEPWCNYPEPFFRALQPDESAAARDPVGMAGLETIALESVVAAIDSLGD